MKVIDDDEPWFEPKSHGYGSGMPIVWQGWATLGLFVAGLVVAGLLLMPHDPLSFAVVTVILIAALLIVASRKTRGGWRWRWGKEK